VVARSAETSELRPQEATKRVGHFSPSLLCLLGHLHQSLQQCQSLAKHLALYHQRNTLPHRRTDPKELAHFIKRSAKACCRRDISQTAHGIGALFDPTVILFQSIVEIRVGSMEDLSAEGLCWLLVASDRQMRPLRTPNHVSAPCRFLCWLHWLSVRKKGKRALNSVGVIHGIVNLFVGMKYIDEL
jgi:hypothetical protein